MDAASVPLCLQSPTQQHYSTYDEAHLKPIMQHMARNVVLVTEGKTKFTVSLIGAAVVELKDETESLFLCRL